MIIHSWFLELEVLFVPTQAKFVLQFVVFILIIG